MGKMSIVKKKRLRPTSHSRFLDKRGIYPINQPIHHAGTYTIHDHWSRYCEHLRADTENKSLCLCPVRTQ